MTEATAGSLTAQAPTETPVEAAEHAHACANCGAHLQGPFCHACGQKGHLHGRLWHLVHEFAEGIAHFDGRLWRTLPLLIFKPGRLSREWRLGKRVRYVAPLHVFLFAVFLLFLVPSLTGARVFDFSGARLGDGAALTAPGVVVNLGNDSNAAVAARERDMEAKIEKKLKQPEYLSYKMEMLAYKLSWVLVPLSIAILALLLAFKRGFTLYDHAVVSLYGLGFVALLVTLLMVLDGAFPAWMEVILGVSVGVHAVFHLKGAYGLSRTGALLRAAPLLVLNVAGFVAFVLAVAALGVLG